MTSQTIFILAVVVAFATVSMSLPQASVPIRITPSADENGMPTIDLPDETKQEILQYVSEQMDQRLPNLAGQTRTFNTLFNLSSYINAPGRPNGTAVTFVPLITFLSGLFPSG